MKLADFDFRIWDNREQCYLNENYLENSPFQAMGLVKAHKSSFFGHNFDKVALFSAGEDKECGFGWNSGDDDDSYELELWTGMKDKNGKKIYEGDIVCFKNRDKYNDDRDEVLAKHIKEKCLKKTFLAQIFFKNVGGGYCIEREAKKGKKYLGKRYFSLFDMSFYLNFRLEVVGNIHENLALLQTSQNE